MRILLDTYNTELKYGSGIATYGRNLRQANNDSGHQLDFLYEFMGGATRDPVLNEVAFFDQRRGTGSARLDKVWLSARAVGQIVLPRRIRAYEVPIAGYVQDRTARHRPERGDRVLTAPLLYRIAAYHFTLTGRFLPVTSAVMPDIAHWTSPLPIYMPGIRNVYTIHDFIPLKLPHTTGDNRRRFRRLVDGVVRHADQIITISDTTMRDLAELAPHAMARTTNTFQSVSMAEWILSAPIERNAAFVENLLGLKHREYFAFVSAIEPKKNIARLIEAFQSSNTRYPLLIIGRKAWSYDDELRPLMHEEARMQLAGANTAKRIVLLDHLDANVLHRVLRSARALLFPSLYEGFGLPILEAMTCGTPVMTANYGAMAEVAAPGTALLVDPYDVRDMVQAIDRLTNDDDLCRDLSAAGEARAAFFSPESYRARLGHAYRQALDGTRGRTWQ